MTHSSEFPTIAPSTLAAIEFPDHFIVERRPNLPGQLADPGKLQLFGGHINPDETPEGAIRRELSEELGLELTQKPPLVWSSTIESQDTAGQLVQRHVNLFYVALAADTLLAPQDPGVIERIPNQLEAVLAREGDLATFAFRALKRITSGELGRLRRY